MRLRVGDIELEIVSGGTFRLDGGGMFGVIPRPLWTRLVTPDDLGRIPLDTNCVLARAGDELVLVDTGNGGKLPERERGFFDLAGGNPLLENLAASGVGPEEITLVVLTHLHMDHCGGASILQGGDPVAAFPHARYLVQRQEWEDALRNRSHMRVSYRMENLLPLQASGRLELLDGDAEVVPGIRVRVTGGHTRAHQAVYFQSRGETAVFAGDLCPTVAHLRPAYNMAYDMEPYQTMLAKADLLHRIARQGWLLLFDHEPAQRAVRLVETEQGIHPVPAG